MKYKQTIVINELDESAHRHFWLFPASPFGSVQELCASEIKRSGLLPRSSACACALLDFFGVCTHARIIKLDVLWEITYNRVIHTTSSIWKNSPCKIRKRKRQLWTQHRWTQTRLSSKRSLKILDFRVDWKFILISIDHNSNFGNSNAFI